MSEEKCKVCGKESEYPGDWYYNDGIGQAKLVCPFCGVEHEVEK